MLQLQGDPLVKSTKRLGMARDDRVQLLLVSIQSADQVTDLIQNASNPAVLMVSLLYPV